MSTYVSYCEAPLLLVQSAMQRGPVDYARGSFVPLTPFLRADSTLTAVLRKSLHHRNAVQASRKHGDDGCSAWVGHRSQQRRLDAVNPCCIHLSTSPLRCRMGRNSGVPTVLSIPFKLLNDKGVACYRPSVPDDAFQRTSPVIVKRRKALYLVLLGCVTLMQYRR